MSTTSCPSIDSFTSFRLSFPRAFRPTKSSSIILRNVVFPFSVIASHLWPGELTLLRWLSATALLITARFTKYQNHREKAGQEGQHYMDASFSRWWLICSSSHIHKYYTPRLAGSGKRGENLEKTLWMSSDRSPQEDPYYVSCELFNIFVTSDPIWSQYFRSMLWLRNVFIISQQDGAPDKRREFIIIRFVHWMCQHICTKSFKRN